MCNEIEFQKHVETKLADKEITAFDFNRLKTYRRNKMADKFRWIANDIDISGFYDRLGSGVKELIAEAEQADKNDCNPAYCEKYYPR